MSSALNEPMVSTLETQRLSEKPKEAGPEPAQPYNVARSIIRYGSFTPSERLVMLALGMLAMAGTIAAVREIAGTTREHTARILSQLIKRGIVKTSVLRFPPTGAGIQVYTITFQPPREPSKWSIRGPDAFVDAAEVAWVRSSGVSYAEGFVELADPVSS